MVYANNYLVKRRKREFGLYQLLGMTRGQVSVVLFCETAIASIASFLIGLLTGVLLSQLLVFVTAALFGDRVTNFAFQFSPMAAAFTLGCFVLIFLVMTVGPYEPLKVRSVTALAARARQSCTEAGETGVAPETLWLVCGDVLVWGIDPEAHPAGTDTLVSDLASTVGLTVVRRECLADSVIAGDVEYDEAFLVSDEYGVVPASDVLADRADRFRQGYEKLLASADAKASRHI